MRVSLICASVWCLLCGAVGGVRRSLANIYTNESFDALTPKAYALALTNAYRALHEDTDPLTRGPFSIERAYTQQWADRLQYAPILEHSGYTGLGENIAFAYGNGTDAGARAAIKEAYRMFYDEEVQDYYDNVTGAVTGHFTQIVWRASQMMTFAYTHDPRTGRYAMVAHFLPQGNVFGEFAANVGARKELKSPLQPQISPLQPQISPLQPQISPLQPQTPFLRPPPPPPPSPPLRTTCEVIIQEAIREAERCRSSGGKVLKLG